MAHSTVMRFRRPPENKMELIHKTVHVGNLPFGSLEVGELELVYNDWYQRQSRTEKLMVFPLK